MESNDMCLTRRQLIALAAAATALPLMIYETRNTGYRDRVLGDSGWILSTGDFRLIESKHA